MKSHRIILIGGCFLAFGAAFANTSVLLKTGTSVSHLTGDISRLSIDLFRTTPDIMTDLYRVSSATFSFFTGAFLAGLLIHHPSLDLARPYGRTITGIGFLLLLSSWLMPGHPIAGISLSALACGLQNSLATRYRGIVLRTTHLTGLITDFGVTLGMSVRGFEIPRWKVFVPAILTAGFFLGGAVSCFVTIRLHLDTLRIAGFAYIGSGILWTLSKHIILPAMQKRFQA